MRHALIIAPSFAPVSNPPTLRVRLFARHLHRFGWDVTVLAVRADRYEEPADPDITTLLPVGLPVVRCNALPARLTRLAGVGDIGLRAYGPMRRTLGALCQRARPDAIVIPGPPWYTFRLGPWVARRFDIPYVLDYIDPWVTADPPAGPWWGKGRWHRRVAMALEPRAVLGAAHIVSVSDGTNAAVCARYPKLPADRFTAIPYGFEPGDFAALDAGAAAAPEARSWPAADGHLHLVSVGAMLPRGYETLEALFLGLRQLAPCLRARIRIHFVGTTYDPRRPRPLVLPTARALGVADVVTEHPARVPYLEALRLLRAADGILVLGSDEPHYMASKIFPTIAAQRPYLACVHAASAVCDVVRAAGGPQPADAELITFDDTERARARAGAIAGALERIASRPATRRLAAWPPGLAPYSAEAMTGKLAAILDRVVAGGGRAGVTGAAGTDRCV
jgi:glycosyltransferase involved in cell wall biosynthesis